MANVWSGLKDYLRAQQLLFRDGLWPLFLIPGLLSLLYLPLSMVLSFFVLRDFTTYVHDHWVPGFLQSTVTLIVLGIFLWIVALYLGFLLFRNVIMILYSPILAYLSEATERAGGVGDARDTKEGAPRFAWSETIGSAVRGTSMSLLTLLLSLVGLATAFLIGFIPVIGALVAAIFLPALTVYLSGVGFADPLLERRKFGVSASFRFCWQHRGRIFGHGLGFTLLLLVPVVGWFLAPSYGVVAGTLGAVEVIENEEPGGQNPETGGG